MTSEDWDRIRWLILHKNTQVYEDHEGDWFIDFFTDCVHLRSDQRCGIYDNRPDICKEYANDECLKHGDDKYYNRIFRTQEDIDAYLACN
ncbi:MAG: hypothetical protein A2268_10320 [Candidatus Raymondbacteria bacterium RifOxyA12_full_50_37]|uniref:Zinc/iron-chelating domain-containing protein n=1 Tax=Candidatus Raymondbacteria bacterium RIFOXYD12_FULL_49_13 TaxID=1817890 RepID=A0A1F7FKA4_UNCRA|nr:MAG: hypothetical protein A2268_10320 [Candidatus Raymondbacteria bacterium RifOxyA12_full_50_37]OGJ90157.1 MAG: hypothetical protein A2248_16800 [Candidatus Raymondbacteria bacterium RIFOXYA2_FULL_49_16]OGJ97228.1 MAG: hypothetical protein A2453_01290 [Candidatus Raymondbacteria bacterium RIFOXYC2_FULL_50_21]OGK04496.1 MAG: hypothetical protein A2350_15335 [Candidatus Raymondbacteria bacterium RifOxyB12_full_50_8]OGK06497.1 MAG: hypothetical protein A2487_21430 [Candidatus Raymondbacteria b